MLIIWTNKFFLVIKRNIIQGWCQVRNLYQNQMQTAHPITSDAKLSISCPESINKIYTPLCQEFLFHDKRQYLLSFRHETHRAMQKVILMTWEKQLQSF